ncbi:MAG: LPS-assembly protein LptD [Bauldia sp.]|nr:LPS-assembly protein LptD [Bauldia sp.]
MAAWLRGHRNANQVAAGVLAATLAVPLFLTALPAEAQPLDAIVAAALPPIDPDAPMEVEADQLVYDYDNNTVAAVGGVVINYSGYTLYADRLTYYRNDGRLLATGNVLLREPNGSELRSDEIDITENFATGFIRSLRVETVDQTRFGAATAERADGRTTINDGFYTACEECAEDPTKPPLWQIRATKIIIDQNEHMVYFEGASFELFGRTIARLPRFSTPDPTVTRKTGFLTPSLGYSETLGATVSAPYFWALAPNYDITLNPTLLSRQGFLADIEWRHRVGKGVYTIEVAGIAQQGGEAFTDEDGPDPGADKDLRGGVRTTGSFELSPQWGAGWDVTLASDRAFTRHYGVLNDDRSYTTSEIYLTGISDQNFFDARASYFQILTDASAPQFEQGRQATVHPVVDHRYRFDQPVLGGQLSMTSNVTSVSRDANDDYMADLIDGIPGTETYYRGLEGNFTRASTDLTWERTFIGPAGLVLTPFTYAKADAFFLDPGAAPAELTGESFVGRFMVAGGLEARWPWMIVRPQSSHIIEPIAQIIVRPDEMHAGVLPNEDAQSLVLDDSNLFDFDKFSGFDRQEGGIRGNFGIRYIGTFGSGMTVDALVGQSIHFAGLNSFANPDIAGAGPNSGLETDMSDIVSRLSIEAPSGRRVTARALFDNDSWDLNRGEIEAAGPIGPNITAAASLIYLRDQTSTNDPGVDDALVLRASASANIRDNWRVFGALVYDVENNALVGDSFGLAYDDSCLSISLSFNETRQDYTDLVASKEVWLSIQLRTLGGGVVTSQWDSLSQ